MKHFTRLLTFILLLVSLNTLGKIILPAVFSDNMVLQQQSSVALWGWSNPSETVKIVASWNPRDTVVVKAGNNAFWTTRLRTMEAGGPHTITFLGSSKVELQNVLLGEVWVCSGQSNMEWSVNAGIMNGEQEATQANHPNIRILQLPRMGAATPQQDCCRGLVQKRLVRCRPSDPSLLPRPAGSLGSR